MNKFQVLYDFSELNFLVWFQTIMTEDLSFAPRHPGIRSDQEEVLQEPAPLSREELEMFRAQMKAMSLLHKVGVMPAFVFNFLFLHCFFLLPGAG